MDMWANEAAISSEAEALENALHSQISQVPTLPCFFITCARYMTQGAMESILWSFENGSGARSLPGAAGTSDALPVLAGRPHLERFLSSARALDLLRPMRDSMRDSMRRGGGGVEVDAALPQWGTGLPGEDRVLQTQHEHDDGEGGRRGDDASSEGEGRPHGDEAVGWGY